MGLTIKMFLEITLIDIIVIEPSQLGEELNLMIDKVVRQRFEGKIIKGKGICLKVTQIEKLESKIANATGNLDIKVKLACVIFSSFRGEILSGKIQRSNEKGIEVDFCGVPVFIPESNLFRNTV